MPRSRLEPESDGRKPDTPLLELRLPPPLDGECTLGFQCCRTSSILSFKCDMVVDKRPCPIWRGFRHFNHRFSYSLVKIQLPPTHRTYLRRGQPAEDTLHIYWSVLGLIGTICVSFSISQFTNGWNQCQVNLFRTDGQYKRRILNLPQTITLKEPRIFICQICSVFFLSSKSSGDLLSPD